MCVGWDCGRTGVEGWEQQGSQESSSSSSSSDDQSGQASQMQSSHTYIAPGARWTWPIPSHPSSNPLILGMSQSAGCEATGQWAPIRKMAGFDASRGTGGTEKSQREWHNIIPELLTMVLRYLRTAVSLPTVWPARTWVPGPGSVPACQPVPASLCLPARLPINHCWATPAEDWPEWESSTLVNLAVSPVVLWVARG